MSFNKSRGAAGGLAAGEELLFRGTISRKWTFLLCLSSFCIGFIFTNRMWTMPEPKEIMRRSVLQVDKMNLASSHCAPKSISERKDVAGEVPRTEDAILTLDKTISNLEMELASAKATQDSILNGAPSPESTEKRKYFMVIGINTAFSSRKRRDSVRATWMPQGEKRRKMEEEKGIIIRFIIGHSATSGGILDKAIDAEDRKHGDFLRLDHVEGYLELAAKSKSYFAKAVSMWDAEYFVKVDDDVHVNIATLGSILARHRSKPRVYIGCMKSGPVLAQKGVRYHEPEYWKFGEWGNKYFRHATGQLYAISKDLASYISINQHVLHKYANEDVSLGAWFIGVDAVHIDERRLCCGTPPDCEWKAQAGNVCAASFDWSCSGICKSADRIKEVHQRCGENENAIWNATF
ncbi:probable beta-1,3-galactosyltransferase 2 isoform X1 [Lolium perenne]|uniref:probable beta-1,3-galactosyltransferase 2 isoform X1 n=1 Tax=Lolium perenne TaxID=4522 RepID=UPI0021F50130|nr:probable beta-1,3-galactosyltransferase 2 isoform X1 [Lolium perenne]